MGIRGSQISLAEPLKERWFAHVLPLTDGARRAEGENHDATAAVFIRKAALDTPSALARVAERYRLTGTEVRALMGVMDATGVSDIARDMGVSQATVKTHLQRIFAKTGARRQLDLVKLVAEHAASPFAGQAPARR
ncbi:MAG: hypothetical protein KF723_11905 [Rhizobiaceae bacterium]|nr:hypothetical protein [Rhizobiaceae bacterium]